MKKKFTPCLVLLLSLLFMYSCKKELKDTKICLHDSSVEYLKRWASVFTQVDTYNVDGTVKNRSYIYPHGYFQLNIDFTYSLYSDGDPVNGKWSIDDNCMFVLNARTAQEHKFSVIRLSADSLTIKEVTDHATYIQHYASFQCPSLSSLQYRWDNAVTQEASYKSGVAVHYIYPVGYFKLNPDASYNVLSNNVALNGTWGIASEGCLLVLDKNKPNERSFDVQKVTADSLIIWRKDTVAKVNYLQYYKKHK